MKSKSKQKKKGGNFFRTTFLSGLAVFLPIVVALYVLKYFYGFLSAKLNPLSSIIAAKLTPIIEVILNVFGVEQSTIISNLQNGIALVMALGIVLAIILGGGLIVRTKIGKMIHELIEKPLEKILPLYKLIKKVFSQFTDKDKTPFRQVALIRPFGKHNPTKMIGFVTEECVVKNCECKLAEYECENEDCACARGECACSSETYYTVFCPTSPNPTSGWPYILPADMVEIQEGVSVSETMECILACGAGSLELFRESACRPHDN